MGDPDAPKGHRPHFWPISIVVKRSPISATAKHLFGVATINMFSLVNKLMLASLGQYFFSNRFKWMSLEWEFASLSSGAWRFLNTNILQRSVATRLSFGGIFNYCFAINLLLSVLVKEF